MAKKDTMHVRMTTSLATLTMCYNEGNTYEVDVKLGREWIDKGFAIEVANP